VDRGPAAGVALSFDANLFRVAGSLPRATGSLLFFFRHVPPSAQGNTALAAVGVLLPLDFVLLSFERERGFTLSSLAPVGVLLFVESVIVAVLCRPDPLAVAARAAHHAVAPAPLAFATQLAFAAAAVALLIRFLLFRKPVESGLLWALAASF